MARPKGTKYIDTPDMMWELFEEYREWCKDNPIQKKVSGNKGFVISDEKLQRPLTLEGFENYVANLPGMPKGLDHYFSNQEGNYDDYLGVCKLIRRVIRQDQIEGGLVGIYNSSITQRLNGLTEKSEHRVITEQPLFGDDDD